MEFHQAHLPVIRLSAGHHRARRARHRRGRPGVGVRTAKERALQRGNEGAGLGRLVVGRKGKETRFELDGEEAATFLRAAGADRRTDRAGPGDGEVARPTGFAFPIRRSPRVFITCRAGGKILDQVRELVVFGQIEPIVFRRHETATAPLLSSLMEQMRGCDTAIVQVDANVLPREAEPRGRKAEAISRPYRAPGTLSRTVRSNDS